jgi:hypothetical protein
MRSALVGSLVFAILISVPRATHPFDGERKGVVLGFGMGAGVSSFKQTVTGPGFGTVTSERENEIAVSTDFKFGAGLSHQLLLYYVNRVSWFSMRNAYGDNVIIANGVGLVGASYYFRETCPSSYVLGLVGLSSWSAPFEDNSGSGTGIGVGLGVGLEFRRHWSVEGTVNWGRPRDEDSGVELETDALSLSLTINALAY